MQGYGCRLRAITGPQLLHDGLDVDFDCLFGDEKPFADLPIAVSAGNMPEDIYLTLGQGIAAEILSQMRRHLRRDTFLARMHLADDLDQIFRQPSPAPTIALLNCAARWPADC
jgi:hypothetical protein